MLPRVICALALCVPAAAGADWYRWRDASGTVHVTNQLASLPPAEVERILRSPAPAAAAPADEAADDTAAAGEAGAAEAAADDAAATARRARATRLADNRAYLALLRAAGRDDAATLALENQLEDAVRADADALR